MAKQQRQSPSIAMLCTASARNPGRHDFACSILHESNRPRKETTAYHWIQVESKGKGMNGSSSDSVATINFQFGPSYIAAGLAQEIGNCAHQIFGLAHLALRNQRSPLFIQVGVFVQDFLGPMID